MVNDIMVKFDVKRINRFNVILIWILSTLLTGQSFLTMGISYGIKVLMCTYGASVFSTLVLLFNLKVHSLETVSAVLIPFSTVITASYLGFLGQGQSSSRIFIVYIGTVAMVSMYFRIGLLLSYIGLLNGFLIFLYIVEPLGLMGATVTFHNFITQLLSMDFIFIVFFFLVKWGNEYIQSALSKEKDSQELLAKLTETMGVIDKNTLVLNDSIRKSYDYIKVIENVGEQTSTAVEGIAKGVGEEAASTGQIVGMAGEAVHTIQETKEISGEILKVSENMKDAVIKNSENIQRMIEQMNTIGNAVGAAFSNMAGLQSSMEKINSALSGITAIAQQTNLLALNAAIEAARAGEAGKGFAIVADEVRKLAEMSTETVNEVYEIINAMVSAADTTLEKVADGKTAIEAGNAVIGEVKNSFADLENFIRTINSRIGQEDNMVLDVNKAFSNIMEELKNISAISSDHASATEEILASTMEQTQRITEVTHEMGELDKLSSELRGLLNR